MRQKVTIPRKIFKSNGYGYCTYITGSIFLNLRQSLFLQLETKNNNLTSFYVVGEQQRKNK